MSVSEFQPHQVFQWFEEAMGSEKAAIMMDLLPPVGWGDVATKADLGALRAELRAEISDSRAQTIRTIVLTNVVSNAALVSLVLAAVRL